MTKFTKEVVRNYRNTMLAEMAEVAKKYGVDADFGSIRFSADEFGVRMTVKRKLSDAEIEQTPTRVPGKVKIGSLINHPARKNLMEVVNVTARGSVTVQTNRGAKYRITMVEAEKYMVA